MDRTRWATLSLAEEIFHLLNHSTNGHNRWPNQAEARSPELCPSHTCGWQASSSASCPATVVGRWKKSGAARTPPASQVMAVSQAATQPVTAKHWFQQRLLLLPHCLQTGSLVSLCLSTRWKHWFSLRWSVLAVSLQLQHWSRLVGLWVGKLLLHSGVACFDGPWDLGTCLFSWPWQSLLGWIYLLHSRCDCASVVPPSPPPRALGSSQSCAHAS